MNILDSFNLTGKVALVTGAAGMGGGQTCYGHQLTRALFQAGADVWIASRNMKSNEDFAAQLRSEGYDKIHYGCFDQSIESSVFELRDKIMEEHGRFDILVNNAATRAVECSWYDDMGAFEESLRINGAGLFCVTRAFGKIMVEQKSGSIINIGSYMGHLSADDYLYEDIMDGYVGVDYFYNKGGMHNMTRLFAGYYGRYGVRCNCLTLGGLFNNQNPKFLERYSRKTMLGRIAGEEDAMGIVVFLASDASKYITGTVIPVDGGYSAK